VSWPLSLQDLQAVLSRLVHPQQDNVGAPATTPAASPQSSNTTAGGTTPSAGTTTSAGTTPTATPPAKPSSDWQNVIPAVPAVR
jgi:hypothetical protein